MDGWVNVRKRWKTSSSGSHLCHAGGPVLLCLLEGMQCDTGSPKPGIAPLVEQNSHCKPLLTFCISLSFYML